MKVDIYIADDGIGPSNQDRRCGYLIRGNGHEVCGTKYLEATANNAVITTIVSALDRFTRPADITVFIDCAYVVGKLKRFPQKDGTAKSTLDRWQEGGWITRRGTKVEHKDNWQRLYNKLRVFEQAGGTFDYEKLEDEEMIGRIESLIETAKKNDQQGR